MPAPPSSREGQAAVLVDFLEGPHEAADDRRDVRRAADLAGADGRAGAFQVEGDLVAHQGRLLAHLERRTGRARASPR